MSTSLVKFFARQEPVGHGAEGGKGPAANKVFWGRANRDGAPYIGPFAPNMPEDEYEERVTRVKYPQNGFYDVLDPMQNAVYLEIIDCCLNGWFQLIHLERFWQGTSKHYVEFAVYYMQDGSRLTLTPFNQVPTQPAPNQNDIIYPQHG